MKRSAAEEAGANYDPFGLATAATTTTAAAPQGTEGETLAVAAHYSGRPNGSAEERESSQIIALRKYNNWVKSALLEQFCGSAGGDGCVVALDLCCGKGGDIGKWAKRGARHVVMADVALESVRQALERYDQLTQRTRHVFTATWICADCCRVELSRHVPSGVCYDVVSCQFALHYSFASEKTARALLANASARLRPGGHFVGTIPNADELVRRLKAAPGLEFGNSIYKVKFDSKTDFPRFGARYRFTLLDALDDLPEYLVHFRSLVELAKEYGLELVLGSPFEKFRQEVAAQNSQLALALQRSLGGVDMSQDEHEAFSLYLAFAFRKRSLPLPPYTQASIKIVEPPTDPTC